MKMNGVPMVGVVVVPQPGANHINIADAVHERMEVMKKDLPEDVKYDYGFDNTRFIRASISEVKQTVYEAFALVIIIIFLFLRDWRVTLVPCIVIPVSLIGAFFIMYVCGFSINVLSMLAIVLAVGLVVDDAIVMTENIYIRIERGMKPLEAGIDGAREIFFAVISTTITPVAVFVPIVFMEGNTGRLFREFSFVVAGAVVISSFAALTFTPMLATKLLVKREQQSWFYRKTEPFFRRTEPPLHPRTQCLFATPLDSHCHHGRFALWQVCGCGPAYPPKWHRSRTVRASAYAPQAPKV